jgi:putative MFS transporter
MSGDSKPALTPLTSYQKRLFAFLSVATFFEGYDFLALSQVLPEISSALNLAEAEAGAVVGFINLGAVAAFFLVRYADRWGRKRLLTITIAGYTIFTVATGLSWDVWSFVCFQFFARMFLIAEWATSMVYAAEEFPADRRGMVMGVIQGFSSLGSIVCAGVVPALLVATDYGWRNVYLVGVLPLVVVAYARRGLRETKRFAEQEKPPTPPSVFRIWRTPHRKRVVQLGIIWAATYVCTQVAVTFWKIFAVAERGFTAKEVGAAIAIAAVGSMPLVFYAGRLIDQIGRRYGALVIFGLGALGVLGCFRLESHGALTFALVFGIFGASAVLPVLNAYTTELFPTEYRADAFAWCNNIIGRVGYVLSPVAVGFAAEHIGWGAAVQLTVVGPLLAVALIFLWLPETKNLSLEDTSRAES